MTLRNLTNVLDEVVNMTCFLPILSAFTIDLNASATILIFTIYIKVFYSLQSGIRYRYQIA